MSNQNKKEQNQINEKDIQELSKKYDALLEDYKKNLFDPQILDDIKNKLKSIQSEKIQCPEVEKLINNDILQILRKLFLEEKAVRQTVVKILRYNIEICPQFTQKLLKKMFPIAICKIFEDFKSHFDERFECFKLIHSWLKCSEKNFPLIFCQGISMMSKSDELFKKGCIEFLRNLAIKKPDFCSTIGGFRILINSLIDDTCLDISDNIFFTLLYIINNPNKRKYFNGFADFYKIFAIFTKSDFTVKDKDKTDETTNEEKNKLGVQIELSKEIIQKLLKTWPGYSLIMGDFMAMGSIIESLNTDTSYAIKDSVLHLIKNVIENENMLIDNFTTLTSITKDEFYINKIYLAYILQGLRNNKLYESLIKFIEKDNNNLFDFAYKIALKFTILYSKLSNDDLQLPFLNEKLEKQKQKELEIKNQNNNNNNPNIKVINTNNNQSNEIDEEVVNMKIKIMHLLDQTFYHFNCEDYVNLDLNDLSNEIIIAMNSVLNTQNIKKYNKQYSIESSKKELYLIDNESFQQILKASKILDNKEFTQWDWKNIDEILDIVENRKDLIMDLYRQKFFKRLLFCYMPSKKLFIKLSWIDSNFTYALIGIKFFKLLAQTPEGISILDSSPEDYLFQKTPTWYEDVQQCLEGLLGKNVDKDHPFSIKKVNRTMSKQIFNFLGILSNTTQGEEYLEKKGFYNLIVKFITNDYKYDYILTNLIDNLNLNSKNAIGFMDALIANGTPKIKRYTFEHVKCLLKFGKDINWNIKSMVSVIKDDKEVNSVIISIIRTLISEGRYIDELTDKTYFEKLIEIDKEILYLMMRSRETYNFLENYINKEIETIDMKKIVEDYAEQLEKNMGEIFIYDDYKSDTYHLTVTLPKIENIYDNYTELFWLKQMPFNSTILITDGHQAKNTYYLNNYLEYYESKKIVLYSKPQEDIIVNPNNQTIKFLCLLGDHYIDAKCKDIDNPNTLTFDKTDFDKNSSTSQNDLLTIEKEGITLIFQKVKDGSDILYKLFELHFNIKIRPESIQSLKTPINLLTELPNNETGVESLINIKGIEFLFSYLDDKNAPPKIVKSALWMLAKICSKETYGKDLQEKYKIIEKILDYNSKCQDYAMKGTICYIICYIAQNKNLKPILEENYNFFFNTDICFPKNMDELYMNSKTTYESKKLKEDGEKINKFISLNSESSKIFSDVCSLINSISYKQASENLKKVDTKLFEDPNLLAKVYYVLCRYKYRQALRRYIFQYFDTSLSSQDIVDSCVKKLDAISNNLFESSEEYDNVNEYNNSPPKSNSEIDTCLNKKL